MPTAAAMPAGGSDQAPASLKAGEVDDNAQWDDYLLFRQQYAGPAVHDRDVSERYSVTVNDAQGRPLLGAQVTFYAGDQAVYSARSGANGRVLFFPKALEQAPAVTTWRVVADLDDALAEATLRRGEDYRLTIPLDHPGRAADAALPLDVLFLIDATGSMADEIGKLQESIQQIAARLDALPARPAVRFAMTIYRDRGDLFVTRSFDFTPDVTRFAAALAEVRADGGGDTPESVNEALHRALHGPEWRGAEAVKLVFLVADAAPHLDYAGDYDYAVEMQTAAERGIRVFSVASSGLDDQGEYIFRQIAQFTQGRFIFLTYAPGGGPGDTTTHHVEDFSVQNLDDLVVRLVEEAQATISRQQVASGRQQVAGSGQQGTRGRVAGGRRQKAGRWPGLGDQGIVPGIVTGFSKPGSAENGKRGGRYAPASSMQLVTPNRLCWWPRQTGRSAERLRQGSLGCVIGARHFGATGTTVWKAASFPHPEG